LAYTDNFGIPTSITDYRGLITTYTLDSHGNTTQRTDPDGVSENYTYNSAGQVLTDTDPNGNTTSYAYDSYGRIATVSYPGTGSPVEKLSYDSAGDLQSVTDPMGDTITYTYDQMGRLKTEQDPVQAAAGKDIAYGYDAAGNLVSVTDANGHTTSYGYNARNELLSVTDALNNVKSYTYDAEGNITASIDPLGHATSYTYDANNNETSDTDQLGRITTFNYDNDNEVTSAIDPQGNTTSYGYNSLDEETTVTLPGQTAPTSYTYDADGNVTQVTDPLGHAVTYGYDSLNRETGMTDGAGDHTTYVYDNNGNITAEIDGLGHATSYSYDSRNNEISQTDPSGGGTTSYTHDLANRLNSMTDPDNNTTTYLYDSAKRVTTVVDPLGHDATYAYDLMDNETGMTDPDGRIYQYGYDGDNRETTEKWLPIGGGSAFNTITYTYDAAGRITQEQEAHSKYVFGYDYANELTSVNDQGTTGLPQVTLTYAYDGDGNRTSLDDSLGGLYSYTYDVRNEVVTVTLSGTGVTAERADMVYDAAARMTTLTRYSDLAGTTVVQTSAYVYDAADRTTGIIDKTFGGTTDVSYGYTYDAASRVTQETRSWNAGASTDTVTYGYTNNDQLTSVTHTNSSFASESFSYDTNGNRNSSGYSTGTDNELTSDGTYTYTYDNDGNLISKTQISTGNKTLYTYDYHNRLTEVDSVVAGVTMTLATFTYDALDRRIGMKEGSTTTWTLYDGMGTDLLLDFNASGTQTARYLNGPQGDLVDTVLSRQTSSGVAWYLPDRLGTVRDLINNSGSIIDHVDYGAFGNVLSESNPSNGDRLMGFAGMERDTATGLNLAVYRVEDPGTGRWDGQDPISFSGGDANLYRYVNNQPVDGYDADGMIGIFFDGAWQKRGWKERKERGRKGDIPISRRALGDLGSFYARGANGDIARFLGG
jgi:RHS repeat-associated protein